MGSPSTDSPSEGWGRDRRSLKNGDDTASTGLWTRKSTPSDDRTIRLASGMLKGSSGNAVDLLWDFWSSRSRTRTRADSACKRYKILNSSIYLNRLAFSKLPLTTDSKDAQNSRMV